MFKLEKPRYFFLFFFPSKSQGYHVICVTNQVKVHFPQVISLGNPSLSSSLCGRSAVQKLGAAVFEEAYHCLKTARRQRAGEAEVRASLEKVVPRASDCFEVDQLLYFEEQLLITMGEGPTLQNHRKQRAHFCENPSDT